MKNEENQTFIKSTKPDFNSKFKKFSLLLLMLVILLIPIIFWSGIIEDREYYKDKAVKSVAQAWGNKQTLSTPYMYFEQKKDKNIEKVYLPLNKYIVNVDIQTEIRKKGIYKVPVYLANVTLKGDFINKFGDLSKKDIILEFQVSDSKGFIEEPQFIINNKSIFSNDTQYITKINKPLNSIPFEIKYKIRGCDEIYLDLGGLSNNIEIKGDWASPSFIGEFLPSYREVNKNGFLGKWSVPKIALSNLKKENYSNSDEGKVGISLLLPVDNYRMASRALKYAFLFIALTFISYFIFEITTKNNKRIHPLQYLLLGAAMLIFYLLLVSISEFIPFLWAYIIASLMTIGLIGTYTYFIITKREDIKYTAIITFLLALLYTFLYVLLKIEDFALLAGSLGLFIIIALIMYSTRNVDWYN